VSERLGLASPWARQAFTPADRDAIDAAIPPGCRITVVCDANHAWYTVRGYRGDTLIHGRTTRDPVGAARHMAETLL
jgi:hypothetical protein